MDFFKRFGEELRNQSGGAPGQTDFGSLNGAGAEKIGDVAANSSANNSPLSQEQRNNLKLTNLKYPLDLGVDKVYKHIMRIFIFKQQKSKFDQGLVTNAADRYNFNVSAGQGVSKNVSLPVGYAFAQGSKIVNSKAKSVVAGVGGIGATDLDLNRKAKTPVAYISLYMPDSIQFKDNQDFAAVSVTEALGLAGNFSQSESAAGETTGLLAQATGVFGPGIKDLSIYSKGYALNPQLEILYKGPKNREFTYSFKFIPRNKKEATEIENIVRTLRFHAHPEYSKDIKGSRYLVPPSEFEVDFYISNTTDGAGNILSAARNEHVPRIGQCVLTSVTVDYAAIGAYSTYFDGTPVQIDVNLTFTETVILTKDDILVGY